MFIEVKSKLLQDKWSKQLFKEIDLKVKEQLGKDATWNTFRISYDDFKTAVLKVY